MSFRSAIPVFQLANPIYTGATVSFFTVDEDGVSTGELATLYAEATGAQTAANPQTLDSEGKFASPVYTLVPVIAEVVGPNVGSHTTGVIGVRGTWRGNWATATVYYSTDFVHDPLTGSTYIIKDDYTAGASVAADYAAGHLQLEFDAVGALAIAALSVLANPTNATAALVAMQATAGAGGILAEGGSTLAFRTTFTGNYTWSGTQAINNAVTVTKASAGAINIRSGAAGSFAALTMGRTASEFDFAVVAGANQVGAGTAAGDGVLNAYNNLWLLTNGAETASIGGNVYIGRGTKGSVWSNVAPYNSAIVRVRDRLLVADGVLSTGVSGTRGVTTTLPNTRAGIGINAASGGWTDTPWLSSLYVLSSTGDAAIAGHTATSQQTAVGPFIYDGIGVIGMALADHPSVAYLAWGAYVEGARVSALGGAFGIEAAIANTQSVTTLSIYGANPNPTIAVHTLGSGSSNTFVHTNPSAAYDVEGGLAAFDRGMVFRNNSVADQGGGVFNAINLPSSYRINWFRNNSSADQLQAYITASNTTTGAVVGHDVLSLNFMGTSAGVVRLSGEQFELYSESTNDASFRIGVGATGNRQSALTFAARSSGISDAGLVRSPGVNGKFLISQAGTGSIDVTSPGSTNFWSGASGTLSTVGVGRTASEVFLGVAATTSDLVTGTAAGDAALKATANLFLAASTFLIKLASATGITTFPSNIILPGSSSGSATIAAPSTGGGTVTLFAGSDTVVGKATTDTLTNKTISGASNTITNLAMSMFAATTANRLHGTDGSGNGTLVTLPAAGLTLSAGAIALANDLSAIEALSSTGIAVRTTTDTWAQRTITGTSNRLTVTNGDGVSGNPTLDISTSYVGQATITTLGTIATGVWQGTKVGLAYGGTNADLSATGGTSQVLKQTSAGAAITVAQLTFADLATGTAPAFTLGGTVSGGGNQINNVIIGTSTPLAGAFTTLSATGQITSTLATGTAPLVIASTTVVANLNASLLGGATFAAPGAIGGGTPSTGAFTTLTGSTSITSPLHIGGSAAGSTLTLESTSGAGSSDSIIFKTGSQVTRATINTSGFVSVGANAPGSTYFVDVNRNAATTDSGPGTAALQRWVAADGSDTRIEMATFGAGSSNNITGTIAGGTLASPSATAITKAAFNLLGYVHDGTAYRLTAAITMQTAEAQSATNRGIEILFNTTPIGSTTLTEGLRLIGNAAQFQRGMAIPAGGTAGAGIMLSSTANFGIFVGSGAPTLSAAKGSLYLRSDGSGTGDRAYINTNGSTTWTALTTAA